MSIGLTEKQYLMLSQLAYLDFADATNFGEQYQGKTLGEIAIKLLAPDSTTGQQRVFDGRGGLTNSDFHSLLESVAYGDPVANNPEEPGIHPIEYSGNNSELRNLVLTGFENKNTSTGFVAYAYKDIGSEETLFAFRGSESAPAEGSGLIDWFDNIIGYGVVDHSYQFEDVKDFVNMYKSSGQIYVTGHSKGGANAAYACAEIDGVTGVAFDAPGIGQTLDSIQATRLSESGLINCIAQGDIVGPVLFHPEATKFCQQWDEFFAEGEIKGAKLQDGHYNQALKFDENGNTIAGYRTETSVLFENMTKVLWYAKEDTVTVLSDGIDNFSSNINKYTQLSHTENCNRALK
jgi:hypothetical protein